MLGKTMSFLDKMFASIQNNGNSTLRRKMAFQKEDMDRSNQKIYNLTQKVNKALQGSILPNSDSLDYNGEGLTINV